MNQNKYSNQLSNIMNPTYNPTNSNQIKSSNQSFERKIDEISKDIPKVVSLRRRGGKIVQDCDIYIGRRCTYGGWDLPTSKWANPFTIKKCGSVELAVEKYRNYILENAQLLDDLEELRGKTLGCWCKPGSCHGDVLVELFKKHCM